MGKLLNDVTLDTLYTMRNEKKMSNKEIAHALGISYSYVLSLIGKQPKEITREAISAGRSNCCAPAPVAEAAPPPCLEVINRTILLNGLFGKYEVNVDKGSVFVSFRSEDRYISFELSTDELDTFIDELSAVKRNMSQIHVTKEMW